MKRTFTVIHGSKMNPIGHAQVTEQRSVMTKAADKIKFNQMFIQEAEKLAREEAQGDPWTYHRELNKRLTA